MNHLAEFLLRCIEEDELTASAAVLEHQTWRPCWSVACDYRDVKDDQGEDVGEMTNARVADHTCRWDPARVLAECEAKRLIVARCAHDQAVYDGEHTAALAAETLLALARPYRDSAGFDPAWAQ